MIFPCFFSFSQISKTFHEIQWFFHDLEADLNFNDFSGAVGTLLVQYSSVSTANELRIQYQSCTKPLIYGLYYKRVNRSSANNSKQCEPITHTHFSLTCIVVDIFPEITQHQTGVNLSTARLGRWRRFHRSGGLWRWKNLWLTEHSWHRGFCWWLHGSRRKGGKLVRARAGTDIRRLEVDGFLDWLQILTLYWGN